LRGAVASPGVNTSDLGLQRTVRVEVGVGDTVVVYTTRSGHSGALAEQFAAMIDAPAYEVKDVAGHAGLVGFLRAGFQASRRLSAPMGDPGIDLTDVGTVVLVQPIWASNLSPVLRTWLDAHRAELSGARLAMLASQSGSPPERFRSNVEAELGGLVAFAAIPERLAMQERIDRLEALAGCLQPARA